MTVPSGAGEARIVRAVDLPFEALPGRRSADPLDAADLSLRIVELAPGVARTPHRHPGSAEHVYVVRGRGRIWCGGAAAPVGAGDVITIPAGAAHATLPDEPMLLVCVFPHPDLAANIEELPAPELQ